MGKTRDLFKKIRDAKRTFHVKMGSIKDRNGMDLTEAEDIKKSGERSGNQFSVPDAQLQGAGDEAGEDQPGGLVVKKKKSGKKTQKNYTKKFFTTEIITMV